MKINTVIGVDVSKNTLDVQTLPNKDYLQTTNSLRGFKQITKAIKDKETTLICFENTGLYSVRLAEYLSTNNHLFVMGNAMEIKRSVGIRRGKSDKVDALTIAQYAWLRRNQLEPTKLQSKSISKLKHWLSLRDKLVKQRAAIKGTLTEQKHILLGKEYKELFTVQQAVIKLLTKQLDKVEKAIETLVRQDDLIFLNYKLILSVKGVGKVIAWRVIAATNNFTRFKTWRKFACYCGTAPFENSSGKSIYKPNKLHYLANKKLKALFTLAAMSALQADTELKQYYQNRIINGKNKMSTVNIIRNKLISRIFAVVKRQTPYVDIKKFAA